VGGVGGGEARGGACRASSADTSGGTGTFVPKAWSVTRMTSPWVVVAKGPCWAQREEVRRMWSGRLITWSVGGGCARAGERPEARTKQSPPALACWRTEDSLNRGRRQLT
jgi:hypothetical protein